MKPHDRMPEVSRRERKKDETRERIAEVALGLFNKHGFAATTVDEIAERADVAKGTFFNHFPRKEAVLRHVALEELERLEESVDRALAKDLSARERIYEVFEMGTTIYERLPELSRVIFLEMMKGPEADLFEIDARAHAAVRRLIDDAVTRGELRADADRRRVTELLRGVFLSTTLVWLHCPTLFDLRAEIRERLSLIFEGLDAARA